MAPRFANPAIPGERRRSAVADGDGNGRNHHRNHPFAMGKTVRSALQPRDYIHVYRLGKVASWDVVFYCAGQFLGAVAGVALAALALQGAPAHKAVRYASTLPGIYGDFAAFLAELSISFFLMIAILFASNNKILAPYTRYFAAILIAAYIVFESPVSGMSANPARTFGPAFCGAYWHAVWIYFVAAPMGMLGAAEVFLLARQGKGPYCAKLDHQNDKRCIFCHSGHDPAAATRAEYCA
jgi:aquaporin Z